MSGTASLDRGSRAFSVYLSSATGLQCRVPDGCIQRFAAHPGQTSVGMQLAAAQRNEHELDVHGYEHPKPVEPQRPDFARRVAAHHKVMASRPQGAL